MLWNRKILLLILSAGVVEPRPRDLQEELLPPVNAHVPSPFNFGYEVSNADTGDTKTHQETLEDGVLRGSYSVVQPDGFRRVVNYVSDAEHGFRADVTFEKGYGDVIPSVIKQQASLISAESTGSTSLSQESSSNLFTAKKDSSSSVNLDISDSSSTGNSASAQGFISTGFSSPLVQVSDIKNYGNVEFESSIDSSQSTSGQSSFKDVALINNVAESSSGTGLSSDTTNINSANEASTNTFDPPRHHSLEHYYTNSQISCASCNTGSFGSSNFGSNFPSFSSGSSSSGSSSSGSSSSITSSSGSSNLGSSSSGSSSFGLSSSGSPSSGSPSSGSSSFGSSSSASSSFGLSSSGSQSSGSASSGSSSLGSSSSESSSFGSSISGSSSFGSNNVVSENKNAVLSFTGNSENTVSGPVGVTNFGDIFSRSFLVASENLDNINTVELAKAGFNTDQLYAYKLVRVPIVEEVTRE